MKQNRNQNGDDQMVQAAREAAHADWLEMRVGSFFPPRELAHWSLESRRPYERALKRLEAERAGR